MSTFLADGNLLVALTVSDHVHHAEAISWFDHSGHDLATCPITEGTLLRFLMREGRSDAHLVALARHHDAAVATFDRGLAALHGPAAHLITT